MEIHNTHWFIRLILREFKVVICVAIFLLPLLSIYYALGVKDYIVPMVIFAVFVTIDVAQTFCEKNIYRMLTLGLKEDKSLISHWLFWILVLLPIVSSAALAEISGLFSMRLDMTTDGVKTFYTEGKLFIAIAALSIPLGATAARIHSSHQTAESLRNNDIQRQEERLRSMLHDFMEHRDSYDQKRIQKGKIEKIIDVSVIHSPIRARNSILPVSVDDCFAKKVAIDELVNLLYPYLQFIFCGVDQESQNFIEKCNNRSKYFQQLSLKTQAMASICGIDHFRLSVYASDSGANAIKDCFSNPGFTDMTHMEVQAQGINKTKTNLENIAILFYYSSEIALGYNTYYSKVLECAFEVLVMACESVDINSHRLGLDDLAEIYPQYLELNPSEKTNALIWGGRLGRVNRNQPPDVQFTQINKLRRLCMLDKDHILSKELDKLHRQLIKRRVE